MSGIVAVIGVNIIGVDAGYVIKCALLRLADAAVQRVLAVAIEYEAIGVGGDTRLADLHAARGNQVDMNRIAGQWERFVVYVSSESDIAVV